MPNTSLFGSAYDTSRAQYRIQDIETFAADLNDVRATPLGNIPYNLIGIGRMFT
jgi:hypothetical protein